MSSRSFSIPDPSLISDIRRMIDTPKVWVATGEMAWVDAGGRPRGYTFRERLALSDGTQPASLFVECYYKPSSVPGNADKLSMGLYYLHHRVFAVDENGPSRHRNTVGAGRPYFGQIVGHPQVHTVSDDCIYGYAEPIDPMKFDQLWQFFTDGAGIVGAPPFQSPPLQLGLPV